MLELLALFGVIVVAGAAMLVLTIAAALLKFVFNVAVVPLKLIFIPLLLIFVVVKVVFAIAVVALVAAVLIPLAILFVVIAAPLWLLSTAT